MAIRVLKADKEISFTFPAHFGLNEQIMIVLKREVDNMLRHGVEADDQIIVTISMETLVKIEDES